MPYIIKERRDDLLMSIRTPETAGELNFVITAAVKKYMRYHGLKYRTINDILGALEGAKSEFYRRVAVPYENAKMAENGDVYE